MYRIVFICVGIVPRIVSNCTELYLILYECSHPSRILIVWVLIPPADAELYLFLYESGQHQLHFDPSLALQVVLRDFEVSSVKVVPPQGPGHFGGAIGPPRTEAKPRRQGTPSSQAGASRQTERHELLHISFLHSPFILSSFPHSVLLSHCFETPCSPPLRPSP